MTVENHSQRSKKARTVLAEISDGKHGPVSDAVKWRVSHYTDLVDYAQDRLRLYEQVWQEGPPAKKTSKEEETIT